MDSVTENMDMAEEPDYSNEQEIVDYLMQFTTKESKALQIPGNQNGHYDRTSSNTLEPLKVTTAALRSLVRRLKRKDDKSGLENLIRCIRDRDSETLCIKIPRSLDGRMQVAQRKVVPHMCYFRIFRNWFVSNYHDLEARVTCRYSYAESQQTSFVCLNPYHYEQKKERVGPSPSQGHQNQGYGDQYMDTSQQTPSSGYYSPEHAAMNNNGITSYVPHVPGRNRQPMLPQDPNNQHHDQNSIQSPFLVDSLTDMNNCTSPSSKASNWIKIAYYEESKFVGDFVSHIDPVTVDGGCSPFDNGRFCLRSRSHLERNQKASNLLNHIGRGIEIRKENFEFVLQNNSPYGIFIQSMEWNLRESKDIAEIRKLQPGEKNAIFCIYNFANHLQERVHSIFSPDTPRTDNSVPVSSYQQVANMGNMCVVRCSFIKGWGDNYTRRLVTDCPCWIEISFLKCFEWLDKVMNQMGPPDGVGPTSTS